VQAVPAKPGDSYASTSATTSNSPSQPASNPPPGPGPGTPAGYHNQPAQYANLPALMSLHRYWLNHYGASNTQAAANLKEYNPSIPWDWTAHDTLSIKTSNEHLVPDR
jgi:hypothetical protein